MTIKDIARESGYSISTVSRALNNHKDVSEETKKRIAEIVARHRFVPNSNARQLKQQQTENLAVIVKGSQNVFFSAVLETMHKMIGEEGYEAVVHYQEEDENEIEAALRICRESKPLGLLFLGGGREAFAERFAEITIPAVLVTGYDPTLRFPNLSMVGVDDEKAGYLAIDYLYNKGHREIAVLGGDLSFISASSKRWKGCLICAAEKGIDIEGNYQPAAFSYEGAYHGMKELLARGKPLSAVFAMSDVTAIGAIRAIVDAGFRVPEQISVIGFDGIELGGYYTPSLTTIRQPIEEIVKSSVELLLRSIERGIPARCVEVAAELLERESVGTK